MKAHRFSMTLILALVLASAVVTMCLLSLLMVSPIVPDTQAAQAAATVAPRPSPAPGCGGYLGYGDSRSDSITYPNTICAYRFSGAAGDVVTIAMNAQGGTLDSYLDLQAPSGAVVISDDDSGGNRNSLIGGYALGQGGTYVILAHAWKYQSTGSYTVSLTKGTSGGCGGNISYGGMVSGQLPIGQRCSYTFQGQSGQLITIAMTKRSNTLDPYLWLYHPGGALVGTDDDSGGNYNSLMTYRLTQAGSWTIAAGSYASRSGGPFTLSVK